MAICAAGRGNLNQRVVARGIGDMGGLPAAAMTAGTVARGGLARREADPDTGCSVMTSGTAIVGIGGGADQGVVVAAATAGGCNSDNPAVVWCCDVSRFPGPAMTAGTVAAAGQGLTNSQAAEAAVGIVTAGTGVMGIGCAAEQGVVVTAATAGRGNLNQIAVVRDAGRMGEVKAAGVTAGAVSTGDEVLTNRQTDQSTVDAVTAGTGIVHLRISRIGQWWRIVVAVATAGRSNLNQAVVARSVGCMGRFPATGVTAITVATASRNPWLQVWNRAVTEVTFAQVSAGDRRIDGGTWIVTGQTGCNASDMAKGHVVSI